MIKTAYTNNKDVRAAVQELKEQLLERNEETQIFITKGVVSIIFFASVEYDSEELIQSFNAEFEDITVFGASSGVNICNGKYSTNSIVAMVLPIEVVEDVKVVTLDNVEYGKNIDLLPAIKEFGLHYEGSFFTLPPDVYFGMAFMTFATRMETVLFEHLRRATKIQFTGATAASRDPKTDATFVYAKGKVIKNGAVIALFKSSAAFYFDKIENVVSLPYKYVVSEINNDRRLLIKLDGRLASEVLCSSLNVDIEHFREHIDDYVFGSYIEGVPYLCTIVDITPEGYIEVLQDHILLGTTLNLFKNSTNMVEDTRASIQRITKDSNPLGLFQFQCMNRYKYLKKLGQLSDYETLFVNCPNIGFCAFGEYYISYVNMTSTLLVFNESIDLQEVQSSGKCYELMQILFKEVAKSQASSFSYIRTKLVLKGINPDVFGPTTLDNPKHLALLQQFTNSMRGM